MKDHTLLQAICRTNRVFGQDKSYGLVVDYVGIFDDVAKALNFDEETARKIVSNIDALRGKVRDFVEKCIAFFPGVDRTRNDWEGLLEAQNCLPDNETKDVFGAEYRVLNKVWNALSPDDCLMPFRADYRWLSKVYDSIRPCDDSGRLIWAALGGKTLALVHENIQLEQTPVAEETIALEAELIEQMINEGLDPKKRAKKLEMDLVALIHRRPDDPRFVALGKRVEELRQKVESGLLTSIEYLKTLLDISTEAAQLERTVEPIDSEAKGKAALTRLFESVRNENTPVIIERVVNDIDGIVKLVRFPGWANSSEGRKKVTRSLREIIMVKYKIRDKEVFSKAYGYVEQYY